MLTKLHVRNFKTLENAEVPLGQNVVMIGPNNAGKTTALQALALWQSGLHEWLARRTNGGQADKRSGVTVNRRALTHTPVSDTRALWHDLKVTDATRGDDGGQNTQQIYLDIVVSGDTGGEEWSCGLEFNRANSETIYCRPLRIVDSNGSNTRMPVPELAASARIALLPPMSGLASEEPELQRGRISVLLGEGQTAQVLRNLCFAVYQARSSDWSTIVGEIERMFGAKLGVPQRDPVRGTIELSYRQQGSVTLDLASAGRGMQQTILLLAHLYANPGSTLLLDEPDAHLEIIRQRQVYSLLTETARRAGSQIIAASHSEVVLNEAADKDVVIAFVGKPHRIDDRGSQVLKALKSIGFEQYYQAEQKGWVIYLEGPTDLAILRGFARVLNHPALALLDNAFVHYVANKPILAQDHYYGLLEAKRDLVAIAIFDRLERELPASITFPVRQWRRREIENYLTSRDILLRYAEGMDIPDIDYLAKQATRRNAMEEAISEIEAALKVLDQDPWSIDFKVSDDFLPMVFKRYFEKLKTTDRLNKSDFHVLADVLRADEIDPEIGETLDLIIAQASKAKPAVD
jgi:energy-coupling factor transporter ATP-binding protein EcfA2